MTTGQPSIDHGCDHEPQNSYGSSMLIIYSLAMIINIMHSSDWPTSTTGSHGGCQQGTRYVAQFHPQNQPNDTTGNSQLQRACRLPLKLDLFRSLQPRDGLDVYLRIEEFRARRQWWLTVTKSCQGHCCSNLQLYCCVSQKSAGKCPKKIFCLLKEAMDGSCKLF